jgi:hypothetical protein
MIEGPFSFADARRQRWLAEEHNPKLLVASSELGNKKAKG